LNNSINQSTGKTPNELCYGFQPREAGDIRATIATQDFDTKRREADDSITYAQAMMKIRYDSAHKEWKPQTGQEVFLRLNNYKVPGIKNRKLDSPRTGPFLIKRMVGRLACKLELPKTWKMHPVVSIAELEPTPLSTDPYVCPRRRTVRQPFEEQPEPDTIIEERTRLIGCHKKQRTEYRIRWKGFSTASDTWEQERDIPARLITNYRRIHRQ